MLRLANLEQLEGMLLEAPALVQKFEKREGDFLQSVGTWLLEAEEALTNNRLPAAAEIAARRSEFIASQRGFSIGRPLPKRVSARKAREAHAADLLTRACNVLNTIVAPRRAQVDEAERMMMQIIAIADRMSLIRPSQNGESHTSYLQMVFQTLYDRPELSSLTVRIIGILGKTDTLVVLDRSIASTRQ